MKKRLFAVLAAVALISGCASTSGDNEIDDADAQEAAQQAEEQSEAFVQNAKDRVFFGFDKSNLSAEAVRVLKVQAEYLKANPEKQIVIEGHADDRGTREYNLALGERRAVAVKNYLISRGVDADRIRVISYGKERPAVVGANEAAWSQNRRAVTLVKD
ncbi:MAG: peptidoglycan-associated lipoprotein Pal [Alphaproteobacteria bacterium]|nr:peptidoglycan-associated lipoprotein Pal [Alphaproteobacteria bacterium]